MARLSLPMILMRGMMTTFMLTNIFVNLIRPKLRCKSCLKTIETNKAESKDATLDKVETFNEDTCNVCNYDF